MPSLLFVLYFSVAVSESLSESHLYNSSAAVHECETINLLNVVPYPDSGEFAGWDRGFELIPAGHLATRQVNSRSDLLRGKTLRILNVASEACERNSNDGFLNTFRRILNTSCVHGVIGLYCSAVTNMITPLLSHSDYGYVQLAAATSPLFHVKDFPYLFRSIASSAVFNTAVVALMDSFNWTRVSVIYDSTEFYFESTGNHFTTLISLTSNKTLLSTIPILQRDSVISEIFTIIKNSESRIAYYSVTIEESASILCRAFRQHYLWPSYVYIFLERTVEEILSATVSCTREEMIMAMEGMFSFQYRLKTTNNTELVSGMTYQSYYQEYLEELSRFGRETGMSLQENEYANSLYDQVWAFALAMNQSLNSTLSNASFEHTFERTLGLRMLLTEKLRKVAFNGASGFIRFGPKQEVQTFVDIIQVSEGQPTLIGVFNSYNKTISFMKNLEKVPGDSFRTEPYLVPKWLAVIVLIAQSFTFIVITINTVLLIYLRKEPEIKSSSLYISLIILIGCYLLCISPVLYTANTAFYIPDTTVFTLLCNIELWLSINGLSIVFIALLFRLIRIFHVFRSFRSTGKYWSDKYLALYIFLGSCVAVCILTLHTVSDPLQHYENTTYVPSNPPFYHHYNYCSSELFTVWVFLLYSWLGVVLILVLFLAIQTRHIKRKHFKDTKKVSILVFCVCATFATCIPLSHILLAVNVLIGAYCLKWLAFFSVSLLCQLFLFVPKIYPILLSSTRKSRSKPYASALVRSSMSRTTSL